MSNHSFLALYQFGLAVHEEQSALYRQLITAVRPQEPGEWGPRFHELEAELDELRKAARRVAPEVAQLTGMPVLEILQRVNAFADVVMKILLWQRDAPAPSATERQELECSGKPNRAVKYLSRGYGEMLNKWLPLKELLDIVDVPAGPGSNVKKNRGGHQRQVYDILIKSIDALVNYIREHEGNRPWEDYQKILTLDQEVASPCQAIGLTFPQFSYEGYYDDGITGFCRIPVTCHFEGCHISFDVGWQQAILGLRRTAELQWERESREQVRQRDRDGSSEKSLRESLKEARSQEPAPLAGAATEPSVLRDSSQAEAGPAGEDRSMSAMHKQIDLFVYPDCGSSMPEKYRVLPEVVCPACGQQVCHTG